MAYMPIIDLTSSPEPDESPNKIASAVLAQFQPSKERINKPVGKRPREYVAYSNAASSSLPTGPSHDTQPNRWSNRVRNQSISSYDWSQATQPKPSHSRRSVIQDGGNKPIVGAQRSPAQHNSLAWLLQEKAQKPLPVSEFSAVGSISRPYDLTQDHQQLVKEKGASSDSAWIGRETDARLSDVAHVSSKARSASVWDNQPKSSPAHVNQNQPATSAPPAHNQTNTVLRPLKRPAPVVQSGVDPTPQKRQHISATKYEGTVQHSPRASGPPLARKTRLVDVTDSSLDERVALNDGVHDWDASKHHVLNSVAATGQSAQVLSDDGRLPPVLNPSQNGNPQINNHGHPYSIEEDRLLIRLKKVEKLSWDDIVPHFNGRSRSSLQVRYSTKLASKPAIDASRSPLHVIELEDTPDVAKSQSPDPASRPKRKRKQITAAVDGFIPWSEVMAASKTKMLIYERDSENPPALDHDILSTQDRALPSSLSRLLRQRELGRGGGRAWQSQTSSMSDELREHVCSKYALSHYHQGTSGDVLSVSWSPDGTRFAAGSAAISDNTSMQYNMSRNLLLGDVEHEELRELVDHHEPRPIVSDPKNINALHAMRESQDPRLFVTVTATSFSKDGTKLFTAGKDKKLRVYSTNESLDRVTCRHEVDHAAAVDLLSISNDGLIATGCHMPSESISIYHYGEYELEYRNRLSPTQGEVSGASMPLYPSSLKWGAASQHRHLLLAGFCNDSSIQNDKQFAGATCIWDVHSQRQIPLKAVTCNVFDVAWNPLPSPTSVAFAVASNPSGIAVNKGMKSVVQLFAPNQDALRRVLSWQCPALDINDVIFCPHDANLIACGATDGKVYVWDQRFADRSQKPLHILEHGGSLTVLPDVDRELIDTGVRFLSWGSSKTRLYSGSSDGVIKVWNPYRSPHNAEVEEFTTPRHQRSAIMAGAFSNDSRSLLIGTEVGRISLFSIGRQNHAQQAKRWKMQATPPAPEQISDPCIETKALLTSGKIEFRPCGAMPIRQAVQGPNYDGPFATSTIDIRQAQDAYQLALDFQNQLHLSLDPDKMDLDKAAVRVKDALAALTDQEDRLEFYRSCQPRAEMLQHSLLAAQNHRSLLVNALPYPEEPCRLDCGYFEATAENGADSGASELRIPGCLGSVHKSRVAERPSDDDIGNPAESGICPSCHPFVKSKKKHARCQSCILKQAGLTATCSKCYEPARPAMNETGKSVCAKCHFACFRCGRTAAVSSKSEFISCDFCNLTWEAGVLGYELVTDPRRRNLVGESNSHVETPDSDELGYPEIEHYASQWST